MCTLSQFVVSNQLLCLHMCADNFLFSFFFCSLTLWAQTCQHPSVKTYSGSTQPVRPSVADTHAGPLPAVSPYTVAPVFLWERAMSFISSQHSWFMSGREKGTHFHPLSLDVASQLLIGQVLIFFFPRGNGDVLRTGARVSCQRCWRVTESVQVFECNINVFC